MAASKCSFSGLKILEDQVLDTISTGLCHSTGFKGPNEQGGATVEIESRDCQDMSLLCYCRHSKLPILLVNHSAIVEGLFCARSKVQNSLAAGKWQKIRQQATFFLQTTSTLISIDTL